MPEVKNLISKIGVWEWVLILAVALIIFGPAKLPELGRSIGRAIREFRQASKEISRSISVDDADAQENPEE